MKNFILLMCTCGIVSCSSPNVQKMSDGVVVQISQASTGQPHAVRLKAISDDIIRVTEFPTNAIKDRNSLVVTNQSLYTNVDINDNDSVVTVSTASLQAHVNKYSGSVRFSDLQGNTLLKEVDNTAKFTPITVDGTSGFSTYQQFMSKDDEAFWGLGQHQSDEFNYKGKNESLFQYNTKVSIPFIQSSKHYGILWDSYSLCRFGVPTDYKQLDELFELSTPNGKKGSLLATYTASARHDKQRLSRLENQIYYEDIQTIKNLPSQFPLDGAVVTYDGFIDAKSSGKYFFQLYYAGYVKVVVDGKMVVPERWRTAWNPNAYRFQFTCKKGEKLPLHIEWKPDGSVSYLGLRTVLPKSEEEQNNLSFSTEMGQNIDYYFVKGDNADRIISGYRKLTGKAPIMPKWAMGFWQSRERYRTQKELLGILNHFRENHIPIDNIVQDWNYWAEDAWGSHEFDKNRFPSPKEMIDSVHKQHAKFMISVWPKFYCTTKNFKEFDEKGLMYRQAVKDSLRDWVGPGYVGSFYDAYSDEAKKIFWRQIQEHLYPLGIDAWWMDASEPNVKDCTDMPYRKALCGPTALGSSTEFFNAYALENAKAIYNGQMSTDSTKRVFLLTRSGFAGIQKYSTAVWSGDIASRWEDMKAQITAGLNFSLAGVPYWSMDIGGFCVENRYSRAQQQYLYSGVVNEDLKEWRELNSRWYQFGAFVPLFRAHGQFPYREIWQIAPKGSETYQGILYYMKLRYKLMPYIYSLAAKTYYDDYTLMRALVMDFPDDKETYDIHTQFSFGPSLMACPVYTYGQRRRSVYLPENRGWYNLYDGKYNQGGQTIMADAPMTKMPVFVPAGSIIPMGRDMEYTNQYADDLLDLWVYQGCNGEFTYYNDEGSNLDYLHGHYTKIHISYDDKKQKIILGETNGKWNKQPKLMSIRIHYVTPNSPSGIDVLSSKVKKVEYKGTRLEIQL